MCRAWGSGILAAGQYASANVLVLLGCLSLLIGGWVPFAVILLIMVFGSFADELCGDEWDRLEDRARIFYEVNLYLSLPLMCLLAVLFALYAKEASFTDQPLQTIGAIWVTGYLFALVGATVGHELTHRQGWIPQVVVERSWETTDQFLFFDVGIQEAHVVLFCRFVLQFNPHLDPYALGRQESFPAASVRSRFPATRVA